MTAYTPVSLKMADNHKAQNGAGNRTTDIGKKNGNEKKSRNVDP